MTKEKMQCVLCGCLVEHKAKWKTTTCPDKPTRWEILYKPLNIPRNEEARKALKANKVLHDALDKGLWDPKRPKTAEPILRALGYGKNTIELNEHCDGCEKETEGTKKGNTKGKLRKKKDNDTR